MALKWQMALTAVPNHKSPKFTKGIKRQYMFRNLGSLVDDCIVIFTCPSKFSPISGEQTILLASPGSQSCISFTVAAWTWQWQNSSCSLTSVIVHIGLGGGVSTMHIKFIDVAQDLALKRQKGSSALLHYIKLNFTMRTWKSDPSPTHAVMGNSCSTVLSYATLHYTMYTTIHTKIWSLSSLPSKELPFHYTKLRDTILHYVMQTTICTKIYSFSSPSSMGVQLFHYTTPCHTILDHATPHYTVYTTIRAKIWSFQVYPVWGSSHFTILHRTTPHCTMPHYTILCTLPYVPRSDPFKYIQYGAAAISLYHTTPHYARYTMLCTLHYAHYTMLCTLYYAMYTTICIMIWSFSNPSSKGQQLFHYTTPQHHTTRCYAHYTMPCTLCYVHYTMHTILCYAHYNMHHDLILFKSIQQVRAVVSVYHTMQHHTTRCYAHYTMLCTLCYVHYTMLCTLPHAPWSDPFQIHPARESSCFTIPHHATPHYTMLCTLHYAMQTTVRTKIWSFSSPSSMGEQLFQ